MNPSKCNQQEQFTFVVTKEIPLNPKLLKSASSNWSIIQSELQSICASSEYKMLQSPDIILLDKEWINGPAVQNSPSKLCKQKHSCLAFLLHTVCRIQNCLLIPTKEKVIYRVNYGSKDKSLLQFINSMNSNISTINNSSTEPQNTSKSAVNTLSNRLLESQSELTFKKKEVKILDKMGKEMPWGNYEFEVIDTIDLTDKGFQTFDLYDSFNMSDIL